MTEHTPPPHQGNNDDTRQLPREPGYVDQSGGPGVTHRYPPPGFEQTPGRARSSVSKGAVAAIVAASLAVGVLGGLAGAAGFTALDDLVGGDATTASSPPGNQQQQSLQVSDRNDPEAEPGSVEQVASSVLPSVVKISVSTAQGAAGAGSGIVLSEDGEILTNNHVVEVAAQGGDIAVHFSDGSAARAEVVGTDPLTDLAVIQARDVDGLTPATLGRSGQLDVGEQVVAVGSPFGLEATVTSGIVSALQRPVTVGNQTGTDTTYPAIQTDAAINPGNSGGPLVNMRGEVVGINSSIRTSPSPAGQGGSIGLGFAIPMDKVLPIVEQLRAGEEATHAQLGVRVLDADSSDGLQSGAGIRTVEPGSPAEEAGLERGQVITKVDDVETPSAQALVAAVRAHRPGDTVTLTVATGGGQQETVEVQLASDAGTTEF